jgi:nucleotide-binding universal stress UspA family protein
VSSEERDLVVRRILVAMDASPHSLAALEAAAELAARLEAEVLGLFVEDVNLLRLAELPFTQEVSISTTASRRLGVEEMERQLRAQATRMRRSLAVYAERAQVHWSFQVTRGVISRELLTAASDVDLIALGRTGCSVGGRRRLGSSARVILAEAPCLALILQEGDRLRLPLMVIYDGSPLAQKALTTATALVQGLDSHVIVFILAEGGEAAHRAKAQASEWLHKRDLMARFLLLTGSSASRLARAVQMERGGTLVVPARSPLLKVEALLQLLDEVRVPVLLVR